MGTSKRLGEFEQLLLFALLHPEGEAHGTGIRRLILHRTGREISPGALYTAMDRLEGQGMVSSYLGEATPPRGGRRRRHYRIEPEGRRALHEAWETVRSMAEGVERELGPEEAR